MHWQRILAIPAVLGAGLAFLAMSGSPVSAQTYYGNPYSNQATVSCPGWPSATCTVTLNQSIPPGQSVQVSLPNGQADVTVNCSSGCFPGETFSVTVSPNLLSSGINQYVTPGNCAYGSYLAQYGCTSAYVSIPPMSLYSYTSSSSYFPPAPPFGVQPPTYYTSTPTFNNGYWWQWNNNSSGWQWSHHGNHWHPWSH